MEITLGDTSKVYKIFENNNNETYIEAQFTKWHEDKAQELTIVNNNTYYFEILEVRYIKAKDCDGNECCELHLKGTKGNPKNSNGSTFKIINSCIFNCQTVLLLYDLYNDVDRSAFINEICSCKFENFEAPKHSMGNYLVTT